ncbi:MAG: SurA N-terminal domain-containing protein [Treponema sp.]|jgi:parvulin-like peptidyl-prolyl isomerase|nr:SurA N-terminal domain-containing protein [Treponema sp.]
MKKTTAVILTTFICTAAFAQSNDFAPAVTVRLSKTEVITVKQFKTQIENTEKLARRPLSKEEKQQVLDGMIDEKLVFQDAERNNITVSDAEINKQVDAMRVQMTQQAGRQPSEAEFVQAIKDQTGLDMPAFREYLRKQTLSQKYLLAKKPKLQDSIKEPTEQDVVEFYNLHKAEMVRPDTVRCSMIRVLFGSDRPKAKMLIDKLASEIGSDAAKFDEVMIKGQLQGSGYQAGDAGYLPRMAEVQQMMGQDFMNTAFALKQGTVSKVIEAVEPSRPSVGFYAIIKVTETYAQKQLVLDDIFQLGYPITVRNYIKQGLAQQNQQAAIQQATADIIKELRKSKLFEINQKNIENIMNG